MFNIFSVSLIFFKAQEKQKNSDLRNFRAQKLQGSETSGLRNVENGLEEAENVLTEELFYSSKKNIE